MFRKRHAVQNWVSRTLFIYYFICSHVSRESKRIYFCCSFKLHFSCTNKTVPQPLCNAKLLVAHHLSLCFASRVVECDQMTDSSALLAMEKKIVFQIQRRAKLQGMRRATLEYCSAPKEERSYPEIHETAQTATGTHWWFLAQGLF